VWHLVLELVVVLDREGHQGLGQQGWQREAGGHGAWHGHMVADGPAPEYLPRQCSCPFNWIGRVVGPIGPGASTAGAAMQFGIFTVDDVTTDPTTGRTPTGRERIKSMVAIARQAEEVGLDVFATGEHHNPPFVPSSPTTMLGYVAAQTETLILSTRRP